jgi:uncharacterized protein
MPRPFCPRRVANCPDVAFFKPAGIPLGQLNVVVMPLDEFEAIRLADGQGLEQTEAAKIMGVSRQTFSRIIRSARGKVADFLTNGAALKIEGGPVKSRCAGKRGGASGCGKKGCCKTAKK